MTTNDTYELIVTRVESDDIMPRYEAFIYRSVWAGVCGPFTEPQIVRGMGAAVELADDYGFAIDGWPDVSGNTATYTLIKK